MFNPINAYEPLTNSQKAVGPEAKLIPSGESHFDGYNIDELSRPNNGINAYYKNGPSEENLSLIHKNPARLNSVLGLNSRLAPLFGYSELSSSEQSKNSIIVPFLSNINPYRHYYPIATTTNMSTHNPPESIDSSLNITSPENFNISEKFGLYDYETEERVSAELPTLNTGTEGES